MSSQRFCLRWNNHQSNLLSVFDQLLQDESFVDVTLAVEGQFLRAHKMVLSACSPYFQTMFVGHPDKHPIVILKDVPFADMRSLLDFMYRGEVSVDQDRLTPFLKVAESLRIKGLTEVHEEKCDLPSIASSLLSSAQQNVINSTPPPPPDLHRIHLTQPSKRPSSPSSLDPLLGSGLSGSKRKRGRPRRLSGSSDTPPGMSPEDDSLDDTDLKNNNSNMSDSSYGHGPPDLLEVNMSDHGQISSPSLSEEQQIGSPEQEMIEHDNSEKFCYITPKHEILDTTSSTPTPSISSRESPHLVRDNNGNRSKSQTPTNQHCERYRTEQCNWKDILKRLKKPEISIKVENGDQIGKEVYGITDVPGCQNCVKEDENELENQRFLVENQTRPLLPVEHTFYDKNGNSKSEIFFAHMQRAFYSDITDDSEFIDDDEDDDVMSKYEYDSFKSMVHDQFEGTSSNDGVSSDQFEGINSNSALPLNWSENSKAPDKSSVRQFCIQVAEHLFQCTICGKTYTHISNFSRHFLSAHHGLRQEVPCPVCCRIFTRRDNMLTHMKQVHRLAITRGSASSYIKKLTEPNLATDNNNQTVL